MTRPTDDALLRAHQLVMRGLLLAVYDEGATDAANAYRAYPADVSSPVSVNTSSGA